MLCDGIEMINNNDSLVGSFEAFRSGRQEEFLELLKRMTDGFLQVGQQTYE